VALWGAVKSVIVPGDQVVCVSNGIFGDGFAEMAKSVGAKVSLVSSPYDEPLDVERVAKELDEKRPKLVTAVHCDTPSGTMNRNLAAIGAACHKVGALFLVDFVASAFATPVHVAEWGIDLGLLGSQKVLSLPPDLAIMTVTPRAWTQIQNVGYRGYDAVLPFKTALERRYMPYSHNWRAVCALKHALQKINLEESFARHDLVAAYTRRRIAEMGLELFAPAALSAPTVTAVRMPSDWQWKELDAVLRQREVVFGGSYGSLKEKVFRIGHMGTQADQETVVGALNALENVLKSKK
jgi:aspartate aminotransferase-like enzyme